MANATQHNLQLKVASGASLAVIRFSVSQGLSSLFEAEVVARSLDPAIDPEGIVGKEASFQVALGCRIPGICRDFEQLAVEESDEGLSTYRAVIVPSLWLLSRRSNSRIFLEQDPVSIASELLSEAGISPKLELSGSYQAAAMRVQYNETDFAFLGRVLTEAGIAFCFGTGAEGSGQLLLLDHAHSRAARPEAPIDYVDSPNPEARLPYVTNLRFSESVRPGRYSLRDFDFERPDYPLAAAADHAGPGPADPRYEHYRYAPGSFRGPGDKADEGLGRERALVEEQARQVTRTVAFFETNVLDLAPGDVIAVARHPSPLCDERWLVISTTTLGTPIGTWTVHATAVAASRPYRTLLEPPRKSRIRGVQSAFVIAGEGGEEISADELGRVKLQLPWDREGKGTSWVRVCQPMAGQGFGAQLIPRVGHEVLVAFLEGDPEQPVVIGSLHNAVAQPPYPLPANANRTVWRSASSPGGGGYNEIMMDDTYDAELFYVRAERDLQRTVLRNDLERTGGNRQILVEGDLIIRAKENIVIRSDEDVIIQGGPEVKINEG